MSTDRQSLSPELQAAAIATYAAARGYHVVATHRDDGVSGLSLRGRTGLQTLLAEVIAGEASYEVVLVYDVSRWGRFQNPDQSAHYEYLCAEAGVRVEYCAELFDNDGSMSATLLKSVKRVMAAEYSRELSVKVSRAKQRLAAQGFWEGGPAPFGYRRLMVDDQGRPLQILESGQRKAIQNYRVRLTPGPLAEGDFVRRAFRAFVHADQSRGQIAHFLNEEGAIRLGHRKWRSNAVGELLRNPVYMGAIASQRSLATGLKAGRALKPREDWAMNFEAHPALVTPKLFMAAQAIMDKHLEKRVEKLSDAALLHLLRRVHDAHGSVNNQTLRNLPWAPCDWIYRRRFGSMRAACRAAGFELPDPRRGARRWPNEHQALLRLAELLQRKGRLSIPIIKADPETADPITYRRICGSLTNAYAMIGYVPAAGSIQSSALGKVRLNAAQSRLAKLMGQSMSDNALEATSEPLMSVSPIGFS